MELSFNLILCVLTGLISYLGFQNPELLDKLLHNPYKVRHKNEYYRLISSGFVHADLPHLLFNLIALYSFGGTIELVFVGIFGSPMGRILFVLLFLFAVIVGNLPNSYRYQNNPNYNSLGASGGVSGVIFSFILFFPWSTMYVMFFPIWAILFGVLYLAYSTWAANNQSDRIDHSAHFWGALAGLLFTIVIDPNVINGFLDRLINQFPL
jgi:membrane associated rhomboid family serine protease